MPPFFYVCSFHNFVKNNMTSSKRCLPYYFLLLLVISFFSISSCKTSGKIKKGKIDRSKADQFYNDYSDRLGIQLSGNEDRKLVSTIADWIGTPYRYGGCDKRGTDCSCFVRNVIKEVYGVDLHRSSEDMILDVNKVNKEHLRDGDLVFFKINNDKISHVGIYISDNKFAHASKKRGVVINDLNETYYNKYFYSGGRIKNK